MKPLLLTGFENFLDHPYNPTEKIARAFDGKTIGTKSVPVKVAILPVSFSEARREIKRLLTHESYCAHLSLGLAASRRHITPEVVALNRVHNPKRPDNLGKTYELEWLEELGPLALESTLPLKKMHQALEQHQLPTELSFTAGTYVCNAVMYEALWFCIQQGIALPSGFMHLPPDQDFNRPNTQNNPTLKQLEDGVRVSLEMIVSEVI